MIHQQQSYIYHDINTTKKTSAQKSLCMFTNVLDMNIKTAYRQVGAAKSKRKAIKFGNTP